MTAKSSPEESEPLAPPPGLPASAVEAWREIVVANDFAGNVDRAALEAFCTLMARLREARQRVEDEGMVVKDPRGRVVPHPALAVERQTAEQIRAWGDRFAPLVKPARKRGYMADATAASIANAPHLAQRKYAGPVAAVKTLAWMIDEAQREGMEALQKAMATTVPTYLKACADLQITPASVPAKAVGAAGGGETKAPASKVTDMQERARSRRAAG
ncbi:P27 family phage terminase small subunit [Sinomonas sp. ASV322]|uniref:P27 family phage terminase small subunit n=1 Tax=Sinomonas sp. ASV322 TaxID=3041920 RepID=UPI0027DDFD52|nr:P27 family phage terminase small subunit [Sinomonas sp. ASV322]MDQ4502172.1 P27 family phage terminase small subunit [Sinomonas sp. ASV322]